MLIDFDELRGIIAAKHSVLLDDKDPVLVTVTLNELVLSRYVDILAKQNESHQIALAAALAEHVLAAKEVGGRVITDSAEYSAGMIRETVSRALAEASSTMRRELRDAGESAKDADKNAGAARRASSTAMISAAIAGAAAIVSIAALALLLLLR